MNSEGKYLVALADDHAILRKGLVFIINSFKEFQVILEASEGEELIKNIENAADKPDVIIMDIQMHGMNGYDAAFAIKKRWPDIQILALSMHHNEFSIIRMLRCGARGFLPKEAGPKDLQAAMYSILDGYTYYSDLISEEVIAKAEENVSSKMMDLTKSEILFLRYCCCDYSYKDIADRMTLSQRTIDWYRDKLFEKLGVKTRAGLVVFALQFGLEPPE
ncbi:MAG: response regulator transcription factor [Flavipsychrobacter sp.]|nr:response regulator transcription factor [Flavipsychrobacter sp.]